MTVQSKKIPNDLGSAVVEEMVSQLNTASCMVAVPFQAQAGGVSTGTTAPNLAATSAGMIIFEAAEDVLIEEIKLVFTLAPDAGSGVVIDVLLATENTPLDPLPGANNLIYATDGTGPQFATATLTSLVDATASAAGTGTDANAFTATTGAHGALAAVDYIGRVRLDAGQKLRLLLAAIGAGAQGCTAYIHYRPVKDAITLSPTYPNKMRSFHVTDR